MNIQRGDLLDATTADGRIVRMRALGASMRGHDFPVVWLCTVQEWERVNGAAEEADGIPWPLESVQEIDQPR